MANSSNPVRANWFNVSAVILAAVAIVGGMILLSKGGSFWIITSYSSLTFIAFLICGLGTAGGYLINKRRDQRRGGHERS
jgi:ABC-type multidrug transport system permease subunit